MNNKIKLTCAYSMLLKSLKVKSLTPGFTVVPPVKISCVAFKCDETAKKTFEA